MDAVPVDGYNSSASGPAVCLTRLWGGLLLLAAGVCFVGGDPSWWLSAGREAVATPAAEETLVEVRVEGNTTIPAEHIAKYIHTRPGRSYSRKQIQDDVRSLFSTKWFVSVEPRLRRTKKGLVLVYHVLERPIVSRVEYKGNTKISRKHLDKITGLKRGSPFVVSANRESARRIEKYYREKGFFFVKVTLEKGGRPEDREVIFRIEEGPKVRVGSIRFTGNHFVSGAVLRTKLRTKSAWVWTFGGLYDPATIPDDIAALKQYYHNVGFFDVGVTHEKQFNRSRSLVTLVYHIEEGPRYKVRRIEVNGNRVLKTEAIRQDLKLREGQYFNALQLSKDIDGIKQKYGRLGRLFAKVEAAPRFLENEPGVADLVYDIDEDVVYRIRRVNVVFRDPGSHTRRAVVLNRLLIHPGDLADPKLIRRSETRLRGTQIFEDGRRNPGKGPQIIFRPVKPAESRPRGAVRGQNSDAGASRTTGFVRQPVVETSPPRPAVSPSYRMAGDPVGNPFDLSGLNPDGTERQGIVASPSSLSGSPLSAGGMPSAAAVAQKEDPLPFTTEALPAFHRKRRAARRSGIIRGQSFDRGIEQPGSPLFNNDPNDPLGGAVREGDIDVIVSDTQTGRLMFGVGVNSDAGVVGSIVLNEYNFDILRPPRSWQDIRDGLAWRGGGQRFRLEAVPGNIVSRYLVSWTDPYFLNTDYSLGFSAFYYNRFFPDWDEQRTGGRVQVGRQWTPAFSTTGSIRLEEVRLENPDEPTPAIALDALGSNQLITLGVSFAHDTRDQAFMPGEGHLLEFNVEQAVGEFDYTKLLLSGSQYFTVYQRPDGLGRQILTLRGQVGWTDVGTPLFERFFAGGFQTFRGFNFRGVTPRVGDFGIGGRWMFLGTVEYMLPLLANETLQGVAFTDFGTVENDVGLDQFRVSVGVGVRITIPAMGPVPLAFDFAFPVQDEDFDDERIFNFYVGFTR